MNQAIYIGVDPGVAGGIAALDQDANVVGTWKMPATEADVIAIFRDLYRRAVDRFAGLHAALERVSATPQMGVVSAFTFGRGVGVLRTALLAAEIPFDEVTPGVWQKAIGIRQQTGQRVIGETKKDKNIAKRRAQELFPAVHVTHAIADALLIAEHCRRSRTGQS